MRGQSLWLYWGSWSSFHAWPQTCGPGSSHMAVVVTSSEGKKNRGGKSFKEKGRDKMGVGKTKPSPIPSWHRQQGWALVSLPTSPTTVEKSSLAPALLLSHLTCSLVASEVSVSPPEKLLSLCTCDCCAAASPATSSPCRVCSCPHRAFQMSSSLAFAAPSCHPSRLPVPTLLHWSTPHASSSLRSCVHNDL